ncbi:SusC/RagA family TonB-linked outer membrane protein [Arenibacter certesii]|uniref:SusC/RagA family TonB-linked outer membrane protein n=1 Tax=Arenibacter certesii TaxID=228955 RepID=A0A918IPZ4_9FLAO|nr:SusC/RagA family TonB-linked outer membrane protein [Arenibacter certesii]GGW24773.1 SusC/RagA family TonB-linked outer membrane protein [Arenibacter certesii]
MRNYNDYVTRIGIPLRFKLKIQLSTLVLLSLFFQIQANSDLNRTEIALTLNNVLNLKGQPIQSKVSGTVTDSKGEPIAFANVLVKSSTVGTVTNEFGYYEIMAQSDATLIFSSMGYKEKEVHIQDKDILDVILEDDVETLDEVVVSVGYNAIERKHLASSIAVMDMDKISSRPIVKLNEAFSGTIPGVTRMQGNNLPGSSGSEISIRGLSTLQNASPLVIVDGMEQSLNDIDPNQVKSISVLKDAAAASMYGSRGANGVIIIETNRGATGEFRAEVHTWLSVQDPTDTPNIVNSADYMRLNNEARKMQGQTLLYSEEDIMKSQNGELPNVNWFDVVMRQKSHSYNTSANISGGGGVGTFNLMLGHIKENGLNVNEGTEKFSARFNTNINMGDKFVLLADFYAHRLQVDRLYMNDDGHGLYQRAWWMNPTQDVFYDSELKDHYMLHNNNMNPLARIMEGGLRNNLHDRSTINLRPRYYINDKLHIAANVSYMMNKSAGKHKRETFKFYDGDGIPVETWGHTVGSSQGVSESQITARALLNYETQLRGNKDQIYLVLGTEAMNYTYSDYREISKSSFFSKLNYSFENKYLLEGTIRADGSSKFAPGNRWGVFPSGSIGWNMHNEQFMSSLKNQGIVNNLKLRASYGKIGNENVSPYLWEEIVNNWGWTMRVPNLSFTWEKQKQVNLGFDLTLMDNRLDISFDTYKKDSYDLIYSNFPVPPLTGSLSLESSVNIGEVQNKGWEASAKWSDKIGDFSYSIEGMVFDNKNKVLKAGYSQNDTLIFKGNNDKIWYRGIAVDNYYGYKSNGYFQTQEEVEATEAKLPNTIPGDIKYVDQNGDGIINDEDKINLGDPFPHMNYSININMRYKNWDFSILGQGVGKRLGRLNGMEGYPVLVDGSSNSLGTPRVEYMKKRWTPQNPNSRFPRVWTGSSPNAVLSDVWLSDAAFFRFKSIQLGYTIPSLGNSIRNIRIYLNAQDAITFTKWEGLEPERNGGNGNYPKMATYTLGAKLTIF